VLEGYEERLDTLDVVYGGGLARALLPRLHHRRSDLFATIALERRFNRVVARPRLVLEGK